MENRVASHEEWLKARLELLDAEKKFTRQRDALTRRRMTSFGSDFNFDYHASFASAKIAEGKAYDNYEIRPIDVSDEAAISVFSKNERAEVFHTHSGYGRGIDILDGVYQYLRPCTSGWGRGLRLPDEVSPHDQC